MKIVDYLKRNWTYYFGGVIFFSLLFYGLYKEFKYSLYYNDPEIEIRYTISTITGFEPGAKSPPYFKYVYCVNGREYKGSHSLTGEFRKKSILEMKSFISKKFFLKYPVKDPAYSRLLINKPVPEELLIIPYRDWKEIPTKT